ncbi:Ectonucleotide pyrophosphatase/phosphodiesterase C27A7.1 [Aphelenchoides bicaudatus]|nr:Ectonucleotide pyrophosphatase/phosphodiesterase C27A7.1 [Aphelenchoides bicaudatus]
MAYFNQPDETGHHKKTDQEVDLELKYVEGIIDRMLGQFKRENLLDCINLVIVSDHGMQTLNKRFYINTMMNTRGMLTSNGVIGRVYRGSSPYAPETTVDHLKCKNEKYYRVYDRKRIPTRYHYSRARRIGDIILEGRPGTIFFETKAQEYSLTSDHGYDFIEDNMKAIFFARGPNIRPRTKLPPFQNVELYNLFSDLLQLRKDVPTNGTEGFMSQALNRIQAKTPTSPKKQFTTIRQVFECSTSSSNSNLKACSQESACSSSVSRANQKMNGCSNRVNLNGLFESSDRLCQMKWCSVAVVKSPSTQYGAPTITYEFLEATKQLLYSLCSFVDKKYDGGCSNWTSVFKDESQYRQLEWHSILAGRDSGLHRSADLQFLVYKNFAEGTLNWLQKWTRQYAKKYGKIGVLTAAVYDYNMDGLADEPDFIRQNSRNHEHKRPTHILRLLIRCSDGQWSRDYTTCANADAHRFLAFALPNVVSEANCLSEQGLLASKHYPLERFRIDDKHQILFKQQHLRR